MSKKNDKSGAIVSTGCGCIAWILGAFIVLSVIASIVTAIK